MPGVPSSTTGGRRTARSRKILMAFSPVSVECSVVASARLQMSPSLVFGIAGRGEAVPPSGRVIASTSLVADSAEAEAVGRERPG